MKKIRNSGGAICISRRFFYWIVSAGQPIPSLLAGTSIFWQKYQKIRMMLV
nr:hypothetical protein [uncultured Schaedlerella sp.]